MLLFKKLTEKIKVTDHISFMQEELSKLKQHFSITEHLLSILSKRVKKVFADVNFYFPFEK